MLDEEKGKAQSYNKDLVSFFKMQATNNDINKLYTSIEACWRRSNYKSQEILLIQILARLKKACDEPSDLTNFQQLALLKEQIPDKELHWHAAKGILSLFLTLAITLAITVPLLPFLPPLSVIGISLLISAVGSCYATNEFFNFGFKSHLSVVQYNINNITFFAQSTSESDEKAVTPTEVNNSFVLDEKNMNKPILICIISYYKVPLLLIVMRG